MNKENVVYVCTVEYDSAIKKKEILTFSTTWMDPDGTMLSEISQTERKITYDLSYM